MPTEISFLKIILSKNLIFLHLCKVKSLKIIIQLKIRQLLSFVAIAFMSWLVYSCATPVPPSGGPKDITPPSLKSSLPENHSSGFKGNDIRLNFNEFVSLKDITKQFIISPPLEKQPDVKAKGRSINIRFDEKLKDSTTYSLYFGNSIQDITENNSIPDFQFVFSTDKFVDSLRFSGNVLDAFSMTSEKDILVLLYKNPEDSALYKEKPYYITKTSEKGNFEFTNLRQGKYRLFALKDLNGNYIYDLPTEKVAFAENAIQLNPPSKNQMDTVGIAKLDSIQKKDSLHRIGESIPPQHLVLFQQADSIQKFLKATQIKKGQINFGFKYPVKNPEIIVLKPSLPSDWKIDEFDNERDTLTCWLKGITSDSLEFQIKDNGKILDTVELSLTSNIRGRNLKANKEKYPPLSLNLNINSSNVYDFRHPMQLICSQPVINSKPPEIRLIENKDTLKPELFFADSIKRKINIVHSFKENSNYKMYIPAKSFTDFYGQNNDSTVLTFQTRPFSDYGTLTMNVVMETKGKQYIVQLLSEKNELLDERIITSSEKLKYEYLPPAKYQLKVIEDANSNKKWDTGNILQKIQPEKVLLYPKLIEIRANWDVVEDWHW